MSNAQMIPLCVDLDGTLIRTDMLYESLFQLLKKNVFYVFLLPFWLYRGRAYLKQQIARRVEWDASTLPYNHEFLSWLRSEKLSGRQLILVTASSQAVAEQIAEHVQVFDEVIGSPPGHNLKGSNKRALLEQRFGQGGFDYAGDAYVDLKVWASAHSAVLVNASDALRNAAEKVTKVSKHFPAGKPWWRSLHKALRVYQWVKNVLIFVPLLASHQFYNWPLWGDSIIAFFSFSLAASSAYVLNDLLDLEADRSHPSKHKRPFASGDIPIPIGILLIPTLILGSLLLAALLPLKFFLILVIYYVLTLAYSFRLKRMMLIDVFCLAVLYTLRILAGGSVDEITNPSHWLLAFSIFFFLSLAFVKRYSEILRLCDENADKHTPIKGRAYRYVDLEILANIGVSSGHLAVLVMALYINSPEVRILYDAPELLWSITLLLLYWLSRVWMITHRGDMHDDPIVFAIRDKVSHVAGLVVFLVVFTAIKLNVHV